MKILVPVDGSAHALEAVRFALRLHTLGLDASYVLATVQEPTYLYEMLLTPGSDILENVLGAVGSRALDDAAALFDAAAITFARELASGDPATALIEIADRHQCDMIIMGARGLGVVRAALLGSVSQGVLNAARIPVTIVKHSSLDGAPG
jgi:nucleotide-binding universal stress UspA family protein